MWLGLQEVALEIDGLGLLNRVLRIVVASRTIISFLPREFDG